MSARFFVIWGMHRSGTSLMAGAMRVFGADAGANVLGPDIYNEKGYFEDRDLMALNTAMLSFLGMKWHSLASVGMAETSRLEKAGFLEKARDYLVYRSRQAPAIVLKDPRMTRLAAFWRRVFATTGLDSYNVVVWRDPLAVASSLQKRAENLVTYSPVRNIEHGLLLWLGYTCSALQYTKGMKRVLAGYDEFLKSPLTCLQTIGNRFGLSPDPAAMQEFCSRFVARQLDHSGSSASYALPARVEKLYSDLREASFPDFPEAKQTVWPETDEEKILVSLLDRSNATSVTAQEQI